MKSVSSAQDGQRMSEESIQRRNMGFRGRLPLQMMVLHEDEQRGVEESENY